MPHRLRGEGLFMAVVRKPGDQFAQSGNFRPVKNRKPDKVAATVAPWLCQEVDMTLEADADKIVAIPKQWQQEISVLRKALNCISYGIEVASVKGRDVIPAHALAMSTLLCDDVFPKVDIDYDTAITYLRREAIVVPGGDNITKGYVLLTYGGRPLGWVKHLGNRANNLYPATMRILSSHRPETPPIVVV
jgi:NOL1/NOP2/fmu family ribosome biogenesis protein